MLTGLFFFKAREHKNTRASDANIIIRSGFDVLLLVVSAALLNTTLILDSFLRGEQNSINARVVAHRWCQHHPKRFR